MVKKGIQETTPSFRDNSKKAEDEKYEREMDEVLREQEHYQNVLYDLLVEKN
jgi:hypothetical protein